MPDPRLQKQRRPPLRGTTARTPTDARIRLRISRRGWAIAAASVLLILLGVLLKDPAPIVLGLCGPALLAYTALRARLNLSGLEFTRKTPEEVYAGRDFDLDVYLRNRGRFLDARAIQLVDTVLRFNERDAGFPPIPPGEGRKLEIATRLVGRGTRFHGPVFLSSDFPLGLWKARAHFDLPLRLHCFPRAIVPQDLLSRRSDESPHGEAIHHHRIEEKGNLSAVRQFQPGDRLSAVHWPATARAGQLVVRERDQPTLEATSVLFHSTCPEGDLPAPESFEHSLELLAGVLQFCRRKGTPIDLCASFHNWDTYRLPDPRHLEGALRWLAEAEYQPTTDLAPLVEALQQFPGDHEIFVISNIPLDRWEPHLPALSRPVLCFDNRNLRVHPGRVQAVRRIAIPS